MVNYREEPKSQVVWGYYNFGLLQGIARTRRAAIAAIERNTGEEWAEAKRYMEVHKVRVERYAP